MNYQSYQSTSFFSSLDGLRCISVVAVIWFHSTTLHSNFGVAGVAGVELFFAISGFLITTLLLREKQRNGQISLRQFYIRRVLRIFPVYYAVILIQVGLVLVLDLDKAMVNDFLHNTIYFLSYTQNWFVSLSDDRRVIFYHAWSLATEEQFYVFWPFVLVYFNRFCRPWMIMCGLLLMDQGFEYAINNGYISLGALGNTIITSLATPICMGVLLAYALHDKRSYTMLSRLLTQAWSAPLVAALMIASIAYQGVPDIIRYALMTLFVGTICARDKTVLSPLLTHSWVRYLGAISYGMYLMHMLAINLVRVMMPDNTQYGVDIFVYGLIVTVLISSISYHFYEKPFLRLKSHFQPVRSR